VEYEALHHTNQPAVIGSALLASARGTGYRRIALQLDRPLSMVRRWIRAVRDPDHIAWLRGQAVGWLARVDRDVLGGLRPEATRLAEALTALAAAAVTLRVRVAPRVPAWTLTPRPTSIGTSRSTPRPSRSPPNTIRRCAEGAEAVGAALGFLTVLGESLLRKWLSPTSRLWSATARTASRRATGWAGTSSTCSTTTVAP
jgi:hypothetical protein